MKSKKRKNFIVIDRVKKSDGYLDDDGQKKTKTNKNGNSLNITCHSDGFSCRVSFSLEVQNFSANKSTFSFFFFFLLLLLIRFRPPLFVCVYLFWIDLLNFFLNTYNLHSGLQPSSCLLTGGIGRARLLILSLYLFFLTTFFTSGENVS